MINYNDSLKSPATLNEAGRQLGRHLMSLHLSVQSPTGDQHCIYSGFLLDYRDFSFWITAGHVLGEIENILAATSLKIIGSSWIDGFDVTGAESRPVNVASLDLYKIDAGAIDLGFVALRPYDLIHIDASGAKEFLLERDIARDSDQLPATVYVVGMPHKALVVEKIPRPFQSVQFQFWTHLICVPCCPIRSRNEPESNFWSQKYCFYLRAEPVAGNDGKLITDFHGMSGGPVFGIFEYPGGKVAYRLYGIQSACSDLDPLNLRITDIKMLVGALDAVITAVEKKHGVSFR